LKGELTQLRVVGEMMEVSGKDLGQSKNHARGGWGPKKNKERWVGEKNSKKEAR